MDGCKPYLYKLIGIKEGQEIVAMISENYALVKEFAEEFCFEGYRIEVIKEQEQ